MKYTKEQRIDIGRQVFSHEISHADAEKKYGVVKSCIDRYIQDYKNVNGIPTDTRANRSERPAHVKQELPLDIEAYKAMSKAYAVFMLNTSEYLIRIKQYNSMRSKELYPEKYAHG